MTSGPRARRLIPALVFSAIAAVLTWPLLPGLSSRLGALSGPGDPFLNLWILGWNLHTISSHPAWLLNGRVFDANVFFPSRDALAYSDHQLLQSLSVWPVYAVTHNVTLCYNVVLLVSLVLSAWAMYAFVRRISGSTPGGFAAGLIWGFCPFHFTHLLHIQLQALYWLPLTFLLLHRLLQARRARDAAWLGVAVGLQAETSVYYGVIGVVGLFTAAMVLIAAAGREDMRRTLPLLAVAAIVAGLVAAPGIWPYWRVQQDEGFGRTLFEAEHGSAVAASYLQAPPINLLYGRTGWLRPLPGGGGPLHRRDGPEQDLFPGFVVLALAAVGLAGARRAGAAPIAVAALAVGTVGFILSLGPGGSRALYALLFQWVFGFHAVRAPARFAVLVYFALAVLAGLGIEWTTRSSRAAPAWTAPLVLALIGSEFLNGSVPWVRAPSLSTPSGRWLRAAGRPGPVVYLPIGDERRDTTVMVGSLEHLRPIVNGYSGQRPALYGALVEALADFPAPDALRTLRDLGIVFVVVPDPLRGLTDPSPLVERARLDDGIVYELQWTPAVEAALGETADPVPMPAGPAPFEAGETARYHVRWLGGPMAIPAGQAIVAARKANGDRFVFTAHATTASWTRPFFEADDTFDSRTDAALLPLEYRASLHEGRRRLVRTATFDAPGKHVVITSGQGIPVTLPLAAAARDPLSALFYIRTLPLAAGFEARIPIDDGGQRTTLRLAVVAADQIVVDGRPHDAWQLEPTLTSRSGRGHPLHAALWVSRDPRKLPLRLRVSAAFGTVELELISYDVP
jgi:Protein of unknown function (DUF3108)